MKKKRFMALSAAVLVTAGVAFVFGTASASSDTDPLITLSYLEQVAVPKLKSDILAEMSGTTDTTIDDNGCYAVIELNKGQTVYAKSVCEIIVRPGSKVESVSPFEDQGIADITLGKEVLGGEEIAINSYCLIPRGDDGRGFTVVSEKAYIMIRGDYEIV